MGDQDWATVVLLSCKITIAINNGVATENQRTVVDGNAAFKGHLMDNGVPIMTNNSSLYVFNHHN